MSVIREVTHCKPGKVRPMVEKFWAMGDIVVKLGFGRPRILADVSGPQYWPVNAEFEAENLRGVLEMDDRAMAGALVAEIMAGYHDLIDHGRREILKLESLE